MNVECGKEDWYKWQEIQRKLAGEKGIKEGKRLIEFYSEYKVWNSYSI
jgi:hypothetical protein